MTDNKPHDKKVDNSIDNMNIPEDIKSKLKDTQNKLNSFKDRIIKEFDKYIIGVAMLMPSQQKLNEEAIRKKTEENKTDEQIKKEIHELKEIIEVFVLVDDKDSNKMGKDELHDKLFKVIDKHALEIDKNIKPIVMLLTELRESMYDGKYSILQEIALAYPLYDPTDILAALKISEVHKGMVLKKFEKYIVSYVAAGSLLRGEKSHDIDVYVIVDDTDVKRMSRYELRDRLRSIIITQGFDARDITGVKKEFHIQVYILTDFWESIKDANPVIFTFLRDGVPLYDRGVFMPWKLLLQMGRIKPSPESIDMMMDIGDKLIDRAKKKLLGIAAEDIYYAILNPSQAALMLYGVNPPTPKETIKLFDEILVKKEKLIESKYVRILENTVKTFKDIEHGKILSMTGTQLDKLIKDADIYIKRINKLFEQIEKRRENESIVEMSNNCINVGKELLKEEGIKFTEATFQKNLSTYLKKNHMSEKLVDVLKDVKKAKLDYKQNKIAKAEAEKIKKEARMFIRTIGEHLQRKKLFELERSKIRFKHEDKIGELLVMQDFGFITLDINNKEKKVLKVTLSKEGHFQEVYDSNIKELEDSLTKDKLRENFFINQKIIDELKKIIGHDVEIMAY